MCNEAKREYDLDIESDGVFAAAEKLCAAQEKWQQVWQRFVDTSDAYPALPTLLNRVEIPDLLADVAHYPKANVKQEEELQIALKRVVAATPVDARKLIEGLDSKHANRRNDLWAKLGQSPWALLLAPLTKVAVLTQNSLGGLSPVELGQRHVKPRYPLS